MNEIFDKVGAMERVGEDVELLNELVDICQTEYVDKIVQLRAAVQEGNVKTVTDLSHSLKGAFGNVGSKLGHASAFELEQAGKKGNTPQLQKLLSQMERAVGEFFITYAEEKKKL